MRHDGNATAVIRTVNLTKTYDRRVTVNKLNLTVLPGEIYGFLGPNGAGKTTTIRMLVGLLTPTEGHIELFGQVVKHDTPELRRRLGVMGEHTFLYDDMTGLEYLQFFARFYGVDNAAKRIAALLERVDLLRYGNLLARNFSQGMQKKLSLARALLHEPDLLILDEPVSGLDPYGIIQVREILDEQRQVGRTIFVSSHILSEVERTADRVGILYQGRLVMEDTVEAVRRQLTPQVELNVELQKPVLGLSHALGNLAGVRDIVVNGHHLTIRGESDEDLRAAVAQTIAMAGGLVLTMQTREPSLEEAFVSLTEGGNHESGNGATNGKGVRR